MALCFDTHSTSSHLLDGEALHTSKHVLSAKQPMSGTDAIPSLPLSRYPLGKFALIFVEVGFLTPGGAASLKPEVWKSLLMNSALLWNAGPWEAKHDA